MRSPIAFWRSLARLVPVTVENLLHPHFVELSSESSLLCAISSVVERLLHTQEVAGSNPASRICLYASVSDAGIVTPEEAAPYGITAARSELNYASGAYGVPPCCGSLLRVLTALERFVQARELASPLAVSALLNASPAQVLPPV
jgi:hypothetical protein